MTAKERNKGARQDVRASVVLGVAGENGEALEVEKGLANDLRREKAVRRFPVVSTPPRLPVVIADEILDYYGWLFCQGGFSNLNMTFEQFLAVVAAVSPSGLSPEYADFGGLASE